MTIAEGDTLITAHPYMDDRFVLIRVTSVTAKTVSFDVWNRGNASWVRPAMKNVRIPGRVFYQVPAGADPAEITASLDAAREVHEDARYLARAAYLTTVAAMGEKIA